MLAIFLVSIPNGAFFFFNKKNDVLIFGQSLVTNLVVAKNYNFTQYRYTRCEFWQIYR